jgi:hypothetical protein
LINSTFKLSYHTIFFNFKDLFYIHGLKDLFEFPKWIYLNLFRIIYDEITLEILKINLFYLKKNFSFQMNIIETLN